MPEGASPEAILLATARVSLVDAINLLWVAALPPDDADTHQSETRREAEALADLSVAAVAYAQRVPRPSWLDAVNDDEEFVSKLREVLAAERKKDDASLADDTEPGAALKWEELGDSGVWAKVREGRRRVKSAAVNLVARPSAEKLRTKVVPKLTDFLGDVLVYISERPRLVEGTRQSGGEIADAIAGELRKAYDERRDEDPLVVIAHSMGGNIVHDVLTRHPNMQGINVDLLVTVGSQVGFFEELSLFGKHPGIPGPTAVRLTRPAAVQRWINIFDCNDLLSFRLAPIFDGVEDYEFRTGKLSAHGAYFLQPGFHARLAERVRGRR
jgi:hypothetical protein